MSKVTEIVERYQAWTSVEGLNLPPPMSLEQEVAYRQGLLRKDWPSLVPPPPLHPFQLPHNHPDYRPLGAPLEAKGRKRRRRRLRRRQRHLRR